MWYENSNAENIKPETIDNTSSQKWVYIRKDFELIEPEQDSETEEERLTYWKWQELKIPKEALAIWQYNTKNAEDVDAITECILEISEIIYA
jgi:hypothetical protein